MSVKLRIPDAQRYFAQKIASIEKTIAESERKIREIGPFSFMVPQSIRDGLETFKSNLLGYQAILGNHAAWSKCMESPVQFDFQSGGASKALLGHDARGHAFLFLNCIYEVIGPFSVEEAKLVLTKHVARERGDLDDPQEADAATYDRRPIPEAVRREVWRRDSGRCVSCGAKERLEFDHIVPFSKGGSSTARNLQLLCEICNRPKSDSI